MEFKSMALLGRMCKRNPDQRIGSFREVLQQIGVLQFPAMEFSPTETTVYRRFADELFDLLASLNQPAKFHDDYKRVIAKLDAAFRTFMLEEYVPRTSTVLGCFIASSYSFRTSRRIAVETVKEFAEMFASAGEEKGRAILANVCERLKSAPHEDAPLKNPFSDDDIPF